MNWERPYWVPDSRGVWHRGFGKDLDTACGLPVSDEMMKKSRDRARGKACPDCLANNTDAQSKGQGGEHG